MRYHVAAFLLTVVAACTAEEPVTEPPRDDHDVDTTAGPEAGFSFGLPPLHAEEGPPIHINDGWIGGPCESDTDCPYEGARCLLDADGFPQGMCSLDCAEFCPDQDGAVATFCTSTGELGIGAQLAAEGLCTTRCDYGVSPSGCRAGYQCQVAARYNDTATEVYACVPGEDDPFPLTDCHQELLARGIGFTPAVNPDDSPPGLPNVTCVIDRPIWVSPHLGGVAFHPSSLQSEPAAMFTSCPHALAMANTADVLMTAGVDALVHYGVYNCRVIAGTQTLSQHGRANALDIAGLGVAGGEYYTVLDDWEANQPNPTTPPGQLLKSFVQTLYGDQIYNIILTPDYNADHENHFHCDLTEGSHFLE